MPPPRFAVRIESIMRARRFMLALLPVVLACMSLDAQASMLPRVLSAAIENANSDADSMPQAPAARPVSAATEKATQKADETQNKEHNKNNKQTNKHEETRNKQYWPYRAFRVTEISYIN